MLILGVSARAAASSVMRCGLRPHCADLFADRDLAAACPVERVEFASGPAGFADVAGSLPPSPWFYTGGLENHPALVERISRRHRLWGVGADVLERVRDPFAVAGALTAAGIPALEVRDDPRGLPSDGSWMVKPRASGGGVGVAPFVGLAIADPASRYYQERIEGPGFSGLFIGDGGRARLVGMARQWVGGVPGRPFAYRGGIAPWHPGPATAARVAAMGDRLASAFGLVGWFGVDYIFCHGIPWPVEVNPRYTASVELHELASGRPFLPEHRAACEGLGVDPAVEPRRGRGRRYRVAAKWIVYAPGRLVMPDVEIENPGTDGPDPFAAAADIPAPGTCIEAGDPVLTLLARDSDAAACRAGLTRLRRAWSIRLGFGDD